MRFVFSLLFILIFSQQSLRACSCGEWGFDMSVETSDEIFIGEVVRIEHDRYPFLSDYSEVKYTFKISKKWKGNHSNQMSIYVESGCAPIFDISQEYIIYAYKWHSQIEEMILELTDYSTDSYIEKIPGYQMETIACLRLKNVRWYQEEAPFRDEIALLDSVFVDPVKLRPYYLNGKNLLLVTFLFGAAGWIWRRRTENLPYRSSEKEM